MAIIPGALHRSTALRLILTALCVLGLLVPDAGGRRHHRRAGCAPFSCGRLGNVSSPFRRRGDPPECGVASYELTCAHGDKATIQIDDATYFVTDINYTSSTFWVVDANILDSSRSSNDSNCTLPRWNQLRRTRSIELASTAWANSACFVNCSEEINNNWKYTPVACMSTSRSFVYASISALEYCPISDLEPSCGYLAMTPLGGRRFDSMAPLENSSYEDVVKLMAAGFAVRFPFRINRGRFQECLQFTRDAASGAGSKQGIDNIAFIDFKFWSCLVRKSHDMSPVYVYAVLFPVPIAASILKWIAVLCRFVLAPLSVFTFLAHKYWRTRITVDAVEKFLRMQLMHGPTRYAYSDITAITAHFREKLGQGGYGSVYKGVLQPGHVRVAVKVLGNSNCNGDEFISEVSTIGRIHHVNVVRLVGFCSEEMRRALVYEYMPRGSLDKCIFSSDKRFSWDKLNEIALGIARGINYLHQGCDMQILHFDIKPHNILLDDNFVPKVADFGLAKLYPKDNSFVPLSALRGTVGYIAPEMISRSFGAISTKSDVYSFGMLLLEMAGGRRNSDRHAENSSQAYYPSWVYGQLTHQVVVVGVGDQDEISAAASSDIHELERKLCIVGLHCIQMKSHDRPTMSEVIEMLEGGVDGLQMPSRPFFCEDDQFPGEDDSCHFSSELTAITEEDE